MGVFWGFGKLKNLFTQADKEQLKKNTTEIAQNKTDIAQNKTDIAQNKQDINDALDEIDIVDAKVEANKTDITSLKNNKADINNTSQNLISKTYKAYTTGKNLTLTENSLIARKYETGVSGGLYFFQKTDTTTNREVLFPVLEGIKYSVGGSTTSGNSFGIKLEIIDGNEIKYRVTPSSGGRIEVVGDYDLTTKNYVDSQISSSQPVITYSNELNVPSTGLTFNMSFDKWIIIYVTYKYNFSSYNAQYQILASTMSGFSQTDYRININHADQFIGYLRVVPNIVNTTRKVSVYYYNNSGEISTVKVRYQE